MAFIEEIDPEADAAAAPATAPLPQATAPSPPAASDSFAKAKEMAAPPAPSASAAAQAVAAAATGTGAANGANAKFFDDAAEKLLHSDSFRDAFLKTLDQSDAPGVEKAKAALEALDKQQAAEQMGKKKVNPATLSCVRDGWWYESSEPPEVEPLALARLRDLAKASGNSSAKETNWSLAQEHYYTAMELSWQLKPGGDDELGTLHSNCSLMALRMNDADSALEHADTSARLRPKWAKAHARRAAALEALGRLVEACEAYGEAVKHSTPAESANNEYATALARADDAKHAKCREDEARKEATAGAERAAAEAAQAAADAEEMGEPLDAPASFEPRNVRISRAV